MKTFVLTAILFFGLTACSNENNQQVKLAYLNSCIQQESASRSAEQAKSYCDCAADSVFNNRSISEETKKLMPTINDKSSKIYQQSDIATVRGLLMSCYTAKFYKK